jgi:thioredoxin reductase (NADPH)
LSFIIHIITIHAWLAEDIMENIPGNPNQNADAQYSDEIAATGGNTVAGSANPKTQVTCDVLILGAGPAGLTAAIYAARSLLVTVVLDVSLVGGLVATTFQIANYPGVNGVVSGTRLMENMKNQAVSFGAVIHDMQRILSVGLEGKEKRVETETAVYHSGTIIIATGAQPRKLPVPMEQEYRSRGVHYCATCDGALYRDAEVMVAGGGISALEEAEFLMRYAKRVTIINRAETFRAPPGVTRHVLGLPGISARYRSQITAVSGDVFVTSATVRDTVSGITEEVPVEGIFVYIGSQPDTRLFSPALELSPGGFILAGEDMRTSIPGVFAAGDIRGKAIRQITTAVSDGTVAAVMAERYLSETYLAG